MAWFVEVVLFLDHRLKLLPSAPPLTTDDIRIDNSRVVCINPPPSASSTPRDDAFSSDLSVICELFLTSLLILEDNSTLDYPLDPNHRDLIVQETCPIDASVPFLQIWLTLHAKRLVTALVGERARRGLWTLPEHSIFRQKDVETSKELADVVNAVRKRYTKETIQEEILIFHEWKGADLQIGLGTDLKVYTQIRHFLVHFD
ncbi:hypothetical protein BLNAU_11005 [Blattamonas nauphoetae]|uniref:Uncharacterized protein n=1 Tax=Blattamonas nauphoetae TaxID=2049346 RepID=A0ABQ9XSI5_9EUKA|nr:hypothetical protein BLNAU_11005 [Blattamonas nauphoetae]